MCDSIIMCRLFVMYALACCITRLFVSVHGYMLCVVCVVGVTVLVIDSGVLYYVLVYVLLASGVFLFF